MGNQKESTERKPLTVDWNGKSERIDREGAVTVDWNGKSERIDREEAPHGRLE